MGWGGESGERFSTNAWVAATTSGQSLDLSRHENDGSSLKER